MRGWPGGVASIFELFDRKILSIPFALEEHIGPVFTLLKKYSNPPMSLADACLVRMAELHENGAILTLDGDFRVYRKHKYRSIPLLIPDDKI